MYLDFIFKQQVPILVVFLVVIYKFYQRFVSTRIRAIEDDYGAFASQVPGGPPTPQDIHVV